MQRSGFQAVLSWANQRSVSERGVSPEVSLSAVLKLASLKDQWRVKISGRSKNNRFQELLFWLSPLKCFFFCISFQLDVPLACSQHMQLVPFLVRNLRKPSVMPTHTKGYCAECWDAPLPLPIWRWRRIDPSPTWLWVKKRAPPNWMAFIPLIIISHC